MEAASPELDLYLARSDFHVLVSMRETSRQYVLQAKGQRVGELWRKSLFYFVFCISPAAAAASRFAPRAAVCVSASVRFRCAGLSRSGSASPARPPLTSPLSPLVTDGPRGPLPVPPPSAHTSPAPGRETPLNRRTLRASSPSPPGATGRGGRGFRYRAGLRTRKLPAWAVPPQGGRGVNRKWMRERRYKRTRPTLPDRQQGVRSQRGVGNAYGLLFPTGSKVTLPAQPQKRIRTTLPDRQRSQRCRRNARTDYSSRRAARDAAGGQLRAGGRGKLRS